METAFEKLSKCFLSVTSLKSILNPILNTILDESCSKIEQKILQSTIDHPTAIKYPPPTAYKKYFLRLLLDNVESREFEPSEELLLAYTDTLKNDTSITDFDFYSYVLNDQSLLTLEESKAFISHGTTGLRTWEAAKYFAEWCFQNPAVFANKRILELGCGIGMLGHCILKTCQPSCYIFTDNSSLVLAELSQNLRMNNVPDNVREMLQMDWSNVNLEHCKDLNPDYIVATDILYDPSDIPDILQALELFLNNGTQACFITCTVRNEDTLSTFTKLLASSQLDSEILTEVKKSVFLYDDNFSFRLYKITL